MTHNPWKTRGTRMVYQNPWITVREDQVVRPDGNDGIYSVVETRLATGVIALTPEDEVYLVGQYRYTMDEYSWEIIEGGSDPGEDALEAAKRELREEAGLEAAHWEALGGEIHLTNCHSNERGYLYVATGLTEVGASPDGTELLQLRRLPFADALAMLDAGEIRDALSEIGLLRLARKRASQHT